MRILFINEAYWPEVGGCEVLTRSLARALHDRGHAVAILANLTDAERAPISVVDGIEVRRFAFKEALERPDVAEMRALIAKVETLKREFQPDVVHVNFPAGAAFFHLQCIRPGESTVVMFHVAVHLGMGTLAPLARLIAKRADVRVVPSRFLVRETAAALYIMPEAFRVIENGVAETQLVSIRALSDPPPRRFLFAGRLSKAKGLMVAVDAIANLCQRGVAAELLLAGAGPLGSSVLAAQESGQQKGRIVLLGQLSQEELATRFDEVAALVVPSLAKEAFSLVSAEAAFAGRPVLAARWGALPETVVDGETGLLFEPGDPASLADVMQRVLLEPGLAVRLGAAARQRAQSRYRLSSMVDRYENLYREQVTSGLGNRSTKGAADLNPWSAFLS